MNSAMPKLIQRMVAGRVLSIEHSPSQMAYLDTFQSVGGNLWPASDLMIKYLKDSGAVRGKRVLELGSGCGYVGLACGVLGAQKVTLTDRVITERRMEYDAEGILIEHVSPPNRILLDLCWDNIRRNTSDQINTEFDVRELEWGDTNAQHITSLDNEIYDIILGSDVTYHADLSESLFWTVSELLKRAKKANFSKSGGDCKGISFLAAHQFRLDSATAKTLASSKQFGLHCTTLATSGTGTTAVSQSGPVDHSAEEAAVTSGTLAGGAAVRRYVNEPGVKDEFALWRFTLAPRPCN